MKAQALGDQINPYLYPPLDPNASSFHKKSPIGLGYLTDRNFVDNFLQEVIYLALVANI